MLPNISERDFVGFRSSTQPCILKEVVDRPNLGHYRLRETQKRLEVATGKTEALTGYAKHTKHKLLQAA